MADHISKLIGETPLVLLDALSQETGLRVLAKYEAANPGASIKDRAARSMIDAAEERGEIAPGRTVLVEPTSGNTGVGLAAVLVGYLVLPWYFISTGVYLNWPPVHTPDQVVRLFIGVNAVGIWDELFFICIVFTLYRRHFKLWQANLLQAMIFVSFLWELGYQSWGPLLTIPFALVQGAIFQLTKNLAYVITVHLLFDLVVFLVLLHGHNPGWPHIFITA